jgi:hypothetical protein
MAAVDAGAVDLTSTPNDFIGNLDAAGPCLSAPTGLVGWWAGDGNASDSSSSADNGTPVGTVAYSPGKVRSAFQLAGAGYVEVPNAAPLNLTSALTLEAWVLSGTSQTARIVNKITANTVDGYLLDVVAGKARLYVGNQTVTGGSLLPVGVFVHVAGVFDGTSLTVYVNGLNDGSKNVPAMNAPVNTLPLRIGADSAAMNQWSGLIDEVSLYSRALKPAEVQAIYATGSGGKCH